MFTLLLRWRVISFFLGLLLGPKMVYFSKHAAFDALLKHMDWVPEQFQCECVVQKRALAQACSRLHTGMCPEEVLSALGSPHRIDASYANEIGCEELWYYEHIVVHFTKGRYIRASKAHFIGHAMQALFASDD